MCIALVWFSLLIGLGTLIADWMDKPARARRCVPVVGDPGAALRMTRQRTDRRGRLSLRGTSRVPSPTCNGENYDDEVRGVLHRARVAQFVLNFEPQSDEKEVILKIRDGKVYGAVERIK